MLNRITTLTYHNALRVTRTACLVALACISGCAGSAIVTGQERNPIDPAAVTLYDEPPAQYKVVGIVEAWSGAGVFFVSASRKHVFSKLKKEAAKIGANGVIEWEIWDEKRGFSFHASNFGRSTSTRAVGRAKAIYVTLVNQSE